MPQGISLASKCSFTLSLCLEAILRVYKVYTDLFCFKIFGTVIPSISDKRESYI